MCILMDVRDARCVGASCSASRTQDVCSHKHDLGLPAVCHHILIVRAAQTSSRLLLLMAVRGSQGGVKRGWGGGGGGCVSFWTWTSSKLALAQRGSPPPSSPDAYNLRAAHAMLIKTVSAESVGGSRVQMEGGGGGGGGRRCACRTWTSSQLALLQRDVSISSAPNRYLESHQQGCSREIDQGLLLLRVVGGAGKGVCGWGGGGGGVCLCCWTSTGSKLALPQMISPPPPPPPPPPPLLSMDCCLGAKTAHFDLAGRPSPSRACRCQLQHSARVFRPCATSPGPQRHDTASLDGVRDMTDHYWAQCLAISPALIIFQIWCWLTPSGKYDAQGALSNDSRMARWIICTCQAQAFRVMGTAGQGRK